MKSNLEDRSPVIKLLKFFTLKPNFNFYFLNEESPLQSTIHLLENKNSGMRVLTLAQWLASQPCITFNITFIQMFHNIALCQIRLNFANLLMENNITTA